MRPYRRRASSANHSMMCHAARLSTLGFGQRFALLLRQQRGYRRHASRSSAAALRMVAWRSWALVCFQMAKPFSGSEGAVQVFLARMGQPPNHFAGGGVVHGHGFAAGSGLPLAVDAATGYPGMCETW